MFLHLIVTLLMIVAFIMLSAALYIMSLMNTVGHVELGLAGLILLVCASFLGSFTKRK